MSVSLTTLSRMFLRTCEIYPKLNLPDLVLQGYRITRYSADSVRLKYICLMMFA